MWIFYYFNFERNYDVLKSKCPCILLNFRKLKVRLWRVGACERKKRAFFVSFMLSEEYFFNICVLSQYIVYWIYFQNIHTFIYQKSLLHPRFCLFLKSPKAFSVSLRNIYFKEHLSMAASAFFSTYATFSKLHILH